MKYLSASILSIKDNIKDNINKLDKLNIDYLHLDIMDGEFVDNKAFSLDEIKPLIDECHRPFDVHLMVSDLKKYIDDFTNLNPEFITFHYEAASDVPSVIIYIHDKGIKAGIAVNPNTDIEELLPYLGMIDLVLVMSVEPGKGGQKYLDEASSKIDELELVRKAYKYDFLIEVDGGINDTTIKECLNADIFVVGSYITSSTDYENKINTIRSII